MTPDKLIVGSVSEQKAEMNFDRARAPAWFIKAFEQAVRLRGEKSKVIEREKVIDQQARDLAATAVEIEKLRPALSPETERARNAALSVQAAIRDRQAKGFS